MAGKGKKRSNKRRKAYNPTADRRARPTAAAAIHAKIVARNEQLAKHDHPFTDALRDSHHVDLAGQSIIGWGTPNVPASELRELATEAVPYFRERVVDGVAALRDIAGKVDPLALVMHCSLTHLASPGDYYEPTHEGLESKVDFIAGIAGTIEHAEGAELSKDAGLLQRGLNGIEDIFGDEEMLILAEAIAASEGDGMEAASVRYQARLYQLAIRGTSYERFARELAVSAYGMFDAEMEQHLGFTTREALAVGDAAHEWYETFGGRGDFPDVSAAVDDYVEEVREQHGGVPTPAHEAYLRKQLEALHGFAALAYRTTFEPEDLIAHCGLPVERVGAVLEHLSFGPGDVAAEAFCHPLQESPVHRRPFLAWQGRFCLPVPGTLQREIHKLLLPICHAELPQTFAKRFSAKIEDLSLDHLCSMLPGAERHTNLKFTYEEDGEERIGELDGLIILGRTAFFVETKAKRRKGEWKSHDLQHIRKDLKSIIEEALTQAARAVAHVTDAGGEFTFDGRADTVTVPSDDIDRIFIVAPSFYDLGGFGSSLHELRALGLFTDKTLPWAVSMTDLMVIADIIDNPAILLHYVEWRATNAEHYAATDELDLFASYLSGADLPETAHPMHVSTSTTEFDDYYLPEATGSRNPRKPARFLTPPARDFVDRMAAERAVGWYDAAVAVLSMRVKALAWLDVTLRRSKAMLGERAWKLVEDEAGEHAIAVLGTESDWADVATDVLAETSRPCVVVIRAGSKAARPSIMWGVRRTR